MRKSKKFIMAVAALASLSLVAAACSSDDSSTTSSPAAATVTESPAMASETITDIVAGNEDFSTLLAAVTAADLGDTLAGDGPYTVFAPTNEAFAALPPSTLKSLLKPANKDQLAAILTYHVVPGDMMASDVSSGEVTTVNGATFTVDAMDGGVTITDGQGNTANVTATDIVASNGVIHVIDAVLLPPSS